MSEELLIRDLDLYNDAEKLSEMWKASTEGYIILILVPGLDKSVTVNGKRKRLKDCLAKFLFLPV